MNGAAYLRVSTGLQTVDNQRPDIEAWARAHDCQLTIYCESESGWSAGHQHELARMLDDIRSGARKYDVVVVWALDRLSRGGIGPLLQLIHTFAAHGVRLVSLRESFLETAGPMAEVFIAFVAWAAQFESDRKAERIRAGLSRTVKQGTRLGRPPGRKDTRPRRRAGYLLRYAGKQAKETFDKKGNGNALETYTPMSAQAPGK